MTLNFKNVYLKSVYTVAGPEEERGVLKNIDYTFPDFYATKKSIEKAESHLAFVSMKGAIAKASMKSTDIDLLLAGDLLNQITASTYAAKRLEIPYFGLFTACATSTQAFIIAASMISAKQLNSALCTVSSHNLVAEKQFRYPNEYGGPKPKSASYTVTAGTSAVLTNEKTKVKITNGTIGKVIDLGIKNPFEMGAAMAPAAAKTLVTHLSNLNESPEDYDLIITGDLASVGTDIFKEYIKKVHKLKLKNHQDAGMLIYNKNQPVYSGGSGPASLPLYVYSTIIPKLKDKTYKKVLLIATGALHSPIMVNQKLTIPGIAHAITLEAV